ncbi:hypothetical protein [Nocardioides sp. P86]|uniref:hypothetical protein n=1 Tax=Nocardioides sp. P86 TaxID=2939569 RepID=UPI00203F10E4|nr:hypothetical protein [Nocardioides sp. P86]MCM3513851.1 hypothetical protein [Nocardioides sp. P86]
MTQGAGGGIDNHSQALTHTDGFDRNGNSAHADSVIIDLGIAAALEMNELDVLTNSVATEVVNQRVVDVYVDRRFTDWHVDVATELATIKVPNCLGPDGGYHEGLEELRAHPQLRSFREHLRNIPSGNVLPTDQALEISELADAYARRSLQREHRNRPIYQTLGRGALSPAGNAVLPMLGTVANGALQVVETVQEKRRLRSTAWAAFVVALRS